MNSLHYWSVKIKIFCAENYIITATSNMYLTYDSINYDNKHSTWKNVRFQVSWKVQQILFCSIVHNNLSNEEKSFILNHVIPFLNTLNYSSVSLIILQRQALLHAFTAEKVLKYKCQIISTTCRQTHSMWNSFSLLIF